MVVPLAGLVLAAGLGTRIGALSRLRPKPLLPIGASTAFDRAVRALRSGGAGVVLANAAHLSEQVVARGRALDVEVRVEEGGPYGTAGGLSNALAATDADAVAIWNGDIVADIDVASLHAALPGALGVLAVRTAAERGNVGVGADGSIVRLRERVFGREVRSCSFAAVQVLGRDLLRRAPVRGCLVGDLLIPALEGGGRLLAVDTSGPWHDVGDLRAYLDANLAEAPLIEGEVDATVTVGRAIVGRGARVGGSGAIDRVVVWPGARGTAPLTCAIVTGASVVSVEGLDAVA